MRTPAFRLAALVLLLSSAPAGAATVLDYDVEGECGTDFDTMTFDGLQARVDATHGGESTSTIFDDEEQMMYFVMHGSRSFMTMESDDDAVDFQGDVGRSSMIYAEKQTEKVTGVDMQALMAQAMSSQIAACPELAEMGFNDPDYADAAAKCAEKMQKQYTAQSGPQQIEGAREMSRRMSGRDGARGGSGAAPVPEMRWSTTETTRTGERAEIAGVACEREATRRGEALLQEQCVAPLEALPLEPSAKRRLDRMTKIGKGMSAGMMERMPGAAAAQPEQPVVALQRTCWRDGRRTGSATLRIDSGAAVEASTFIVPREYKPIGMGAPGG